MIAILKTAIVILLAAYVLVCIAMWSLQRRFLFAVDPKHVTPESVGLSGLMREEKIKTADGETLVFWSGKAVPGQPTFLYFHGNAGALDERADRIRIQRGFGFGFVIMAYRGFSGSTGSPTEANAFADALAAFDRLVASGVDPKMIVVFGESLGTGVATRVAELRSPGGLILDSPFTSVADIAKQRYWFLPVDLLLTDRFDTISRIASIKAPLLVLHGGKDQVVPLAMGKAVFAKATSQKDMKIYPLAEHIFHAEYGSMEDIRDFARRVTGAPSN